MDIRKVKKLIELLEESDIDELEIHEGEESVRISRHSSKPAVAQQPVYAAAPAPAPAAPLKKQHLHVQNTEALWRVRQWWVLSTVRAHPLQKALLKWVRRLRKGIYCVSLKP